MPDTPSVTSKPPDPRHLIVTVHGIRTFGGWQERLEDILKAEAGSRSSELWITHYKFGYFSVIAFIIPIFRWIVTRRFRKTLERLTAKREWSRIDLIGHSFGTHLIGWALRGLPESSNCKIHTVILSGSVLRMDFPWSELLDTRVERVVNDCGARDAILLLSQFGVLFTGMAGRVGFTGDMTERFRNRFSVFGHSGYFQDRAGAPSEVYMRERWLGLLLGDEPAPHFDARPAGAAEGIVTWLAANAEPIKLTFYTAPILALALWIFTLYRTAETERLIAEAGRLTALSQLRLVKDDNPIEAMRLAIQAVRTLGSNQDKGLADPIVNQLRDSIAANHAKYVFEHDAPVRDAKLAPRGRYLATGTASTVHLWDLETGRLSYSKPVQALSMLAFSPARDILAVADQGTVHLFQTADGSELPALKGPGGGRIQSLLFAPDGRYLATASDASVRIWDVDSGSLLADLWGHQGQVVQIAFNYDGKYLAVAVDDAYMVFIWDVEQAVKGGKLMADRAAGWVDIGGRARQVVFSGGWLVATSLTGGVKAWAVSDVINKTAKPVPLATGNFGPLSTGNYIAAGSTTGRVHILSINAPEIYQLNAARTISDLIDETATQVLFSDVVTRNGVTNLQWQGSTLLTANDDGGVKIWKEQGKTLLRDRPGWVLSSRLRGHVKPVRAASFGPTADSVVTAADNYVYVWDTLPDQKVSETDLQKLCAIAEAQLRSIQKYEGERQVDLQASCSGPR